MENMTIDTPRFASGAQKVSQGARELKDAAFDQASHLKDAAVQRASDFKDKAMQTSSQFVQRGADQMKQACCDTEAMIKEKPFQSLLFACGVGMILGAIFLRSR